MYTQKIYIFFVVVRSIIMLGFRYSGVFIKLEVRSQPSLGQNAIGVPSYIMEIKGHVELLYHHLSEDAVKYWGGGEGTQF